MATPILELIAIGDELLNGTIADTNSATLAGELWRRGYPVARTTVVSDRLADIVLVLREAAARADVLVVGGGLGPTEDDRTAEAGALVAGVGRVRDAAALAHIQAFFTTYGRPMPENNARQADIPAGAEVLYSQVGTAPGFALQLGRARAFFFPGVPREYRWFADTYLLPALAAAFAPRPLAWRTFRCFGGGESQLAKLLCEDTLPGPVDVAYRAALPDIHITLRAGGGSAAEAQQNLEAAAAVLRERIGGFVYGVDDERFPAVVLQRFQARGATLALGESCTGGLVAEMLTAIPGASTVFVGGVVAYANAAKEALLGVRPETLAAHGAVSAETVIEMAHGARRRFGATVGVAVSGIAGPAGGSPEKPVGTVHFAAVTAERTLARVQRWPFDRAGVRVVAAWSALHLALKLIADAPAASDPQP